MLKYKDQLGQFITEDQAKKRGYFSKLYYIHNELKKEEIYFQNTIIGGAYYLSSNEDLIEVLNDLGHHLKWSIMSNQQIINGYTLWEARTYNENIEPYHKYSKLVYDSGDRLIAIISYDTQTNQPKNGIKHFHFGGLHVPDDEDDVFFADEAELSFHFDDNGQIEKIRMNVDIINNEGVWYSLKHFLIDAEDFITQMMTPAQLEYFSHVEPVVPNF